MGYKIEPKSETLPENVRYINQTIMGLALEIMGIILVLVMVACNLGLLIAFIRADGTMAASRYIQEVIDELEDRVTRTEFVNLKTIYQIEMNKPNRAFF